MLLGAFLVLALLLIVQSFFSLQDGYRFLAYLRRSLEAPPSSYHPPATVIVAVKGVDEGFEANLGRLLAQDYPNYSVLFSVASESDPAHPRLADLAVSAGAAVEVRNPGLRAVRVVIAGYASGRGEKVNNLLAALRQVPPATEVLVFADADARPRTDWLR